MSKLTPEEIRKLLRDYFETFPKFEDRLDSENLGSLIKTAAEAQLAHKSEENLLIIKGTEHPEEFTKSRPDLRKTVMDLVTNPPCKHCDHWNAEAAYCSHVINKGTGVYKRCKLVSQILALFDEEEIRKEAACVGIELCCDLEAKVIEAKREERERIANELEADMPSITRYGALQYIRDLYQTLKEEK
jgi:hypothetical protein